MKFRLNSSINNYMVLKRGLYGREVRSNLGHRRDGGASEIYWENNRVDVRTLRARQQ